jgi:hypothetical protein
MHKYKKEKAMRLKDLFVSVLCLSVMAVLTLSGCGGGDGDTAPVTPPVPTAGLLKMSSTGSSLAIGGIDMTISMPAGVTVKADPNTGEASSGVITISGVATAGSSKLATAKFTPAAGGSPAQLHIVMINTTGFGDGEFVSINFDLVGGIDLPSVTAFSVIGISANALDGTPLGGITAAPLSVTPL